MTLRDEEEGHDVIGLTGVERHKSGHLAQPENTQLVQQIKPLHFLNMFNAIPQK